MSRVGVEGLAVRLAVLVVVSLWALPAGAGPARAILGQAGAAGLSAPSIVAGSNYTCVLIGDGRVRCWGRN